MWNECAPGEKLLTKGEVAQLCRVETRTVDRWVAAGKIKCYRIPSGRLLFRKRDVLKRDVLMAADRRDRGVVQTGRCSGAPSDIFFSSEYTGPALPRMSGPDI